MHPQIERLSNLSFKKERTILGLMSGTSLDGLDIALCTLKGFGKNTEMHLEKFSSHEYNNQYRTNIRKVFSKREVDLQTLSGLHAWVGNYHASCVLEVLKNWGISSKDIDLIASHGQSVFHAPQRWTKDNLLPNSTLQIGDGDHIAVKTGIITFSDFRQKHVAAGGEGAPLVAYGDQLLYSHEKEYRVLLNIGGISNYTFLPKKGSKMSAFATDVGPGNTLMNSYMHKYFGLEMDRGASVASKGKVNSTLLEALLGHSFFNEKLPKTTGPELFNLSYVERCKAQSGILPISHEDIMCTLCEFSAKAICDSILSLKNDYAVDITVYISGGGLHNPLLYERIKDRLKSAVPVHSFELLGMNPDAKEACLFAVLANETVAGEGGDYQILDNPNICMGKISLPY